MKRANHYLNTFKVIAGLYLLAIGNVMADPCDQAAFKMYCSGCHTLRYADAPKAALLPEEALRWFGKLPPDLTEIVHVRGATWLTDFLNGFYQDNSRPFGSNNHFLPDVAMPDILATVTPEQRIYLVQDIVCYLETVAEPHRAQEKKIGFMVLGFLSLFTLVYFARWV